MNISSSIILIALCSALSGLLFGYDAGIISGALLFIRQQISMSSVMEGWMVAMVPLGALLSSLISGYLSDVIGRKKTLFFTAAIFMVGSLLCACAHNITILITSRLLLGIAIGIGSSISPVYTSELADKQHRGWLVNLFVVFIQFGIFISFFISYLFSDSGNWRLMIGLGIIPAIILLIATFYLPESPRWLVLKNQVQQARNILTKLMGQQQANACMIEIQSMNHQQTISIKHLFLQKRFLKILFVGIAVSVLTQTVGINAFNYYAPTIFQQTGFASPANATFYTMLMGLALVLSTISSLFFIDAIGRRRPLLFGTVGILIALLTITLGFHCNNNPVWLGWLFLCSAIMFMLFHGISIGPACFLIPSEIFPANVRGAGMGISVACNWGANVLVAALTPWIIHTWGIAILFGIFFLITMLAWLIFYFYIPETKQMSLEELELNLSRA